MPLMIRFLESDKKNRSRLPNDNFVAVQFDDDVVFDAVTHRKNANSGRALATVWASLRLLTRLREKGTRDANCRYYYWIPQDAKKIRRSKSLDNCAHVLFAP